MHSGSAGWESGCRERSLGCWRHASFRHSRFHSARSCTMEIFSTCIGMHHGWGDGWGPVGFREQGYLGCLEIGRALCCLPRFSQCSSAHRKGHFHTGRTMAGGADQSIGTAFALSSAIWRSPPLPALSPVLEVHKSGPYQQALRTPIQWKRWHGRLLKV